MSPLAVAVHSRRSRIATVPAVSVELHGVSKRFDGHAALEPTDLVVPARTCLALIGPSGCGKSTLLRLVVGLIAPDQGRVRIGDTPMTPETRRALRLTMGYVIRRGGLFPHLTVRERGVDRVISAGPAAESRARERAGGADGIAPGAGSFSRALSGGQRQRVGLMRASCSTGAADGRPLGALDR
jgi:ABC-type proline/glycine betaine transport system ATPase subunit